MNLDKSSAYNNICIAGVGGVGGYFGGMIALNITSNFKDKRNIVFIARGAHLEAIQRNGLIIKPFEGDPIKCMPNVVTHKVKDLNLINLLIVAVKGYDLNEMIMSLKDKISTDTVIIPLLNGVGNDLKVRKIIPQGIILPGCAYLSSKIEEPGVIKVMSNIFRIVIGPDPLNPEYDSSEIIAFFKNMGIKIDWTESPQIAIWQKYLFIAPAALITAANNITINGIAHNEAFKQDFFAIMAEIRKIAEKKNIILPESAEAGALKIVENINKDAKSSFQLDVENKKPKTEIDAFGYDIIRMGKEVSVSTPATERVLSKIKL
ncbi:MAG: ketopantoate reductase family protein [Spirochaetes bacterium]|nr:ketopantoate reductase family protein [Spirochaetota bacterium]